MKDGVLILDFGSQYTQLIARRIRELGVYAEIHPFATRLSDLSTLRPRALVLSGGPASVTAAGAPMISPELFDAGLPVLGICYGMQLMSLLLGGKVEPASHREYGRAELVLKRGDSLLFRGVRPGKTVWMSHGDSVRSFPPGFVETARTQDGTLAAIERADRHWYAVQFHPEVVHSEEGKTILANFLFAVSALAKNWDMNDFVAAETDRLREVCRGKKVVVGVSGGVDSTTLAVLLSRAAGDGVRPIFVDNGLLRLGEADRVRRTLRDLGVDLAFVDAREVFLSRLAGIVSPERKRKIIGKTFVDVFYKGLSDFDYLAQGTLYPDVIESNPVAGPSATIKTHHNRVREVKALERQGRILEPFRFLFKDEVRQVARLLGIPAAVFGRHPFPGPGLAVRIVGAVAEDKLEKLRRADAIFIDELERGGQYDQVWQAFAVYLPARSVGVMGDERAYGATIALRAVTSVDGMTAGWARLPADLLDRTANRIVREIPGVNRVVYDITSKPPATIEWE
ncbi:MAG TPA: glutamine-hydrolyzing GMP synthase [Candidatus Aminicenantes bacterium]|nr:glutamine-hydrolyzing GMP synthase [Candidatus Aminicenantes bacterium]